MDRRSTPSCGCAGTTWAWTGALLILVHAGIHFNAVLAWLAVGAMLINILSGLTGKYLLHRTPYTDAHRPRCAAATPSSRSADALGQPDHGVIKQWRSLHVPITLAFAVLRWRISSAPRCSGVGIEIARSSSHPIAALLAGIIALAFVHPLPMVGQPWC